jgi:hypothetical protein
MAVWDAGLTYNKVQTPPLQDTTMRRHRTLNIEVPRNNFRPIFEHTCTQNLVNKFH